MHPWAIFDTSGDADILLYVGLHGSESDCWQIFLGWPSQAEIGEAINRGLRCERVSISRHRI